MAAIRLAKLPDRTAIKLTISILPDLNHRLAAYAQLYRETYGSEELVADLIPHMLDAFLDSDRAFAKARAVVSTKATPNG